MKYQALLNINCCLKILYISRLNIIVKNKILKKIISLLFLISVSLHCQSQNENTKWYFGVNSALDFMTNQPTVLNNSAMLANEGCSSVADAAGNLLFYTNGATIWNKQHAIMANGTGLLGWPSATQSVLIIKHSNNPYLYYVFTNGGNLNYSIVDLSLSVGMGSVTLKNSPIYSAPCTEQLHATKHSNGLDYWIMVHEDSYTTNNFRAYLLSSAGVNTTAVVSSIGSIYSGFNQGSIKFSPTGQKLCAAINIIGVELFDFNNNTGVLSNSLTLLPGIDAYYGCEFSPDGTKLYAGKNLYDPNSNSRLTQWDLSASSSSAIISSSVNFISNSFTPGSMQLAPNGKIYITSSDSSNYLSVINNPNLAGIASSLVIGGQPISAAINTTLNSYARIGLPNMITNITNSPCVTQTVNNPQSVCAGDVYAISNHTYTTTGAYIDTLTNVFSCNGIVIVNTQLTVNSLPNLIVNAGSTICVNDSITLTANGANTYTWSTSQTGASITVTPTITTTYTVYGTDGINGCKSNSQILVSVSPCTYIEDLKVEKEEITIYPVPAGDQIELSISNIKLIKEFHFLLIFNNLGLLIREEEIEFENQSLKIKTDHLPNGVYFIKLKSNFDETLSKRFVIER
jgi:hypothetical protein